MATAVRQIELADGIVDIHLPDGYSALMALVTFHGISLGDITIRVHCGCISWNYLADQIAQRFCGRILQLWLERRMNGGSNPANRGKLPAVDVIVCTSDRPADLQRCLQSLSDTLYSRKSVIIVDNGSQCEATRDVAQKYGARYVREKKRGLDFARNAGLEAGEAELVAFADDDIAVDRMWLANIVQAFQMDTAIACVTGLTMPLELETEAQELFERYSIGGMRRGYERRVFDRSILLPSAAGKVGVGANMAFRSAIFGQIGGFDEALDCGTPARAGGDADMFYRILRRGYKICYEPSVLAWHRHRREMDELRNQLSGYSTAVYAFLTKCAVDYKDFSALSVGYSWFRSHHIRNLALGLIGKGPMPGAMILAEFWNALKGPVAYLKAQSYVSRVRLQFGLERRGRLNGRGGTNVGGSALVHCADAVLARLFGFGRGRRRGA